jgi:predicted alpha-1,2-mannosidase
MTRALIALALLGCTADDTPPTAEADTPIEAYDALEWVDPFIATGGDGAEIASVNPGASVPFGMTLIGPDTRGPWGAVSFYHCAGYWYNDDKIMGFSHMHPHGMGVTDYQILQFMPRDGWSADWIDPALRAAPFTHDEEWATPGSYGVTLQDTGTDVKIAATTRGGISVFTWEEGTDPTLVLDLGFAADGGEVFEADATFEPGSPVFTGYQRMGGGYSKRSGGQRTWFVAELDPAPIGGGGWNTEDAPMAGVTSVEGKDSGVWLTFPEGTTEVTMKLAISSTGPEGAQANFDAELADETYDSVVAGAETSWRDLLGRVRIRGGTDRQRRIFHSALYRSALMPSRHDDADGTYRGLDDALHTADHAYYSDLSLWDTFRTLHPWYILAWPEVQVDIVKSLIRMSEDGGTLPRWPIGHGYSGGMVGSPATQVFSGSWLKGLTDFDVDAAYGAALDVASQQMPRAGRSGIDSYLSEGFVGVEDSGGSVSRTLEFAWSDYALAELGAALGKPEADTLYAQSENWKNLWYADEGFFTGRCGIGADDRCMEDDNPNEFFWPNNPRPHFSWEGHFVEGNAWHYVWYVPYDVDEMIAVQHGGDRDAFAERYEDYWVNGVFVEPDDLASDDWYWHGNEPVMHYAFLGSLMGRPELTADPARWILENRYDDQPVGLDGNDDSGTLSAWYLLASTGFFPVAGTDRYAVSSPLFERVEIDQPDGSTWVVRAPGTSDDVRYLDGLTIDGVDIEGSVVDHATLMSGEVVFSLTD